MAIGLWWLLEMEVLELVVVSLVAVDEDCCSGYNRSTGAITGAVGARR